MAEELRHGPRMARVAKVAAKKTPPDNEFRVVIWSAPKFILGRGWMRRELQPEKDEDDPDYVPPDAPDPPDDSPVWQPAAPPES